MTRHDTPGRRQLPSRFEHRPRPRQRHRPTRKPADHKHKQPTRLQITIESTFATVRLRQRVTKGPGSRAAGIAMAFKLLESAQARWRAVNAPHLVALVRAGARFDKGVIVERQHHEEEAAA